MSSPFRRTALRAALAAAMVVPSFAIVAGVAGAGPSDTLSIVRSWKGVPDARSSQNIRLPLDTKARVAYAVYTSTSGSMVVRGFNLDRLTPLGGVIQESGVGPVQSATPIAIDEKHGAAVVAPLPVANSVPAIPGVRVYGARGKSVVKAGQASSRFPAGYSIIGMTPDLPRDRMLVLGVPTAGEAVRTVGAGVGNVQLDSWKLSDLSQGRIASEWTEPIRVPPTCGQIIAKKFAAGVGVSADGKRAYFACVSNRGVLTTTGPNAGDVAGVVSLDLAAAQAGSASALRIRPVSGDYGPGDSFAVPAKSRIVLTAGAAVNTTVKVFDYAHGYYVGNVGLDNGIAAIGFDPRTARTYYVNGAGLGVFDAASTPVNQGVVYPDLAPHLGILDRVVEVDPVTRRVFAPTSIDGGGTDPFVLVMRDGTPHGEATEQVVEHGLDVDEKPGVYESRRTVDAGATGAEYRMAGGPSALLYNASHVDTRGIVVRPGTRYMQLAATRSVRMTPDEASVQVVTMRSDDATASDLNNTHIAEPVLCNDFGSGVDEEKHPDATVYCDTQKQQASGTVSAEPGRVLMAHAGQTDDPATAAVVARLAKSSVDTKREADGTLLATLHAEAYGIDIMERVQIGKVVAHGTITLHGRTGTAKTTYERSVHGLVIDGDSVCGSCSMEQVAKAVYDTFGGRVVVEFPEPYRVATPKGQRAAITDNPYRHFERTMFDDVAEDSWVTPAMEVIAYLDGASSSRLIAGFAAISAQGRYEISKVSGDDPGPLPTDPAAPPVPPNAPVTGGTTTGPGVTGPAAPQPTTPTVALPPVPSGPIAQLIEGMKIVFRSPKHLASVGALWALLALPTYLAARRRLLLDLPFLRRPVEES